MNGSFDPELNLIYWGVGNPNPDYYGDARPGDNLYSNSLVALDADTGELRWHYQFTPHDLNDWDSNHMPVLAEVNWQGQPVRWSWWVIGTGFFTCSTGSLGNCCSVRLLPRPAGRANLMRMADLLC